MRHTLLSILRSNCEIPIGAALEEEIKALFEHSHRGVDAIVTTIERYDEAISISGNMRVDGRYAGYFSRVVSYDGGRKLLMEHNVLRLTRCASGRGAGRAWVRECLRRYKRHPIGLVEVSCGDKDGGYVWARLGFQLSHTYEAHDAIWLKRKRALLSLQQKGLVSKKDYERWEKRFESGEIKSIQQILNLGRKKAWYDKQGRRCWAGKQLLHGSEWEGIMKLTPARKTSR